MNKGKLHKTLAVGAHLVIGEGPTQLEVIVKKVEGAKVTLTLMADRDIDIRHAEVANG